MTGNDKVLTTGMVVVLVAPLGACGYQWAQGTWHSCITSVTLTHGRTAAVPVQLASNRSHETVAGMGWYLVQEMVSR
jgi:hypothetical protein